jgi:flavin-dependent dehydrogenase
LHHEKTRIVILATGLAGHESQVAPGSRLGAGVIVPEAPAFFARGVIYMATGSGGYVGLVRLEDGRLDVAAAFDAAFVRSAGGLGPAADAILRTTAWPRIDGLAELPWKGTPALTRSRSAVAEHRLFAVGDAAGYIEPFTGQGISWAIAGAAALAPIAERTARGWSDSCIKEWRREHRRVVSSRQLTCRLAARVLRSPRLTRIAVAALAWLPALARPVVASLNRPSHGSRS